MLRIMLVVVAVVQYTACRSCKVKKIVPGLVAFSFHFFVFSKDSSDWKRPLDLRIRLPHLVVKVLIWDLLLSVQHLYSSIGVAHMWPRTEMISLWLCERGKINQKA